MFVVVLNDLQWFCELALAGQRFHIATAKTLSACNLLIITREQFDAVAAEGQDAVCLHLSSTYVKSSLLHVTPPAVPGGLKLQGCRLAVKLRHALVAHRMKGILQQLQFIEHIGEIDLLLVACVRMILFFPVRTTILCLHTQQLQHNVQFR